MKPQSSVDIIVSHICISKSRIITFVKGWSTMLTIQTFLLQRRRTHYTLSFRFYQVLQKIITILVNPFVVHMLLTLFSSIVMHDYILQGHDAGHIIKLSAWRHAGVTVTLRCSAVTWRQSSGQKDRSRGGKEEHGQPRACGRSGFTSDNIRVNTRHISCPQRYGTTSVLCPRLTRQPLISFVPL